MIELIVAERCTGCDLCVQVCPTDVFDPFEGGIPVIARQEVCQTCYMCEAHCPGDAMYVSPLRAPAPPGSRHRDIGQLIATGLLGSYRARLGWGKGRRPPRSFDEAALLASADLSAMPEGTALP